jgi:hypothetical protein
MEVTTTLTEKDEEGNSGFSESVTSYYQLALVISQAMGIVIHMRIGFVFLGQ